MAQTKLEFMTIYGLTHVNNMDKQHFDINFDDFILVMKQNGHRDTVTTVAVGEHQTEEGHEMPGMVPKNVSSY